jgi:hypothetical protein
MSKEISIPYKMGRDDFKRVADRKTVTQVYNARIYLAIKRSNVLAKRLRND